MAKQITKIINFRVPFDLYTEYLEESNKKGITLTDNILHKLNQANKAASLEKELKETKKRLGEAVRNFFESLKTSLEILHLYQKYAKKNGDVIVDDKTKEMFGKFAEELLIKYNIDSNENDL